MTQLSFLATTQCPCRQSSPAGQAQRLDATTSHWPSPQSGSRRTAAVNTFKALEARAAVSRDLSAALDVTHCHADVDESMVRPAYPLDCRITVDRCRFRRLTLERTGSPVSVRQCDYYPLGARGFKVLMLAK